MLRGDKVEVPGERVEFIRDEQACDARVLKLPTPEPLSVVAVAPPLDREVLQD